MKSVFSMTFILHILRKSSSHLVKPTLQFVVIFREITYPSVLFVVASMFYTILDGIVRNSHGTGWSSFCFLLDVLFCHV